jgi:hypothetical protein
MKTLAVLALLSATPALAQSDIRSEDRQRLDRYTITFGDAMLQALSGGTADDVAALTGALSGTPQIAFDESLPGDWKCRTMKLGGNTPLVVYTNFTCRFSIGPQGFDFEKLSGSQRTKGSILLRDGRAIYIGVGYAAGQTPPAYQDLPEDFQSDGTIQTQIAVFERVSSSRARLMFPAPAVESDFDILELTR